MTKEIIQLILLELNFQTFFIRIQKMNYKQELKPLPKMVAIIF